MSVKVTSDSQNKDKNCKIRPFKNGPPDYWVVNSATSISLFYGFDLLYVQAEDSHIFLGIAPNRIIKVLETQHLSCEVLAKYLTYIGPGLSINIIKFHQYIKKNDDLIFCDGSKIQIKCTEGEALRKILNADCHEI